MNDGTALAQYRILGKLGEGGMGQVYRAEDTRLKREVAIKVLPRDLADDPDRLARLEREAQVLARLDHPNIAAIYGIEEAVPRPPGGAPPSAGGIPAETAGDPAISGRSDTGSSAPVLFLVMQLAEGETLDDLLDRRGGATDSARTRSEAVTAVPSPSAPQPDEAPLRYRGLPLEEALPVAVGIAEALQAAHAQGIIHRDLKPANVKVTLDHDEPRVKVLDFGLATVYQDDDDDTAADPSASPTMMASTQAGLIVGTAGYMSPEQARGQRVDQRADIWAFGVLLYEMLTGRRLFHGETVSDTLAAVLKDAVDLGALPGDTPLPVRRLLRRCLRRDPRRRLHHIADATLELEDARTGLLGNDADDVRALTGAAEPPRTASSPPPRRGLTWRLATAAVALLALGVTIGLLARRTAAPEQAPVRVYGDLGPSAARSAVVSPDGRKLALHIDDELWVRDFDSLDTLLIEGSTDHRGRPFWSPDGRLLGFFANGGLHVAEVDGGTSRRLAGDIRLTSSAATWTREGIIAAAAGRQQGELVLLSLEGDVQRTVARSPSPGRLGSPLLLPDGETLVYEFSERRDGVFVDGTVMVQHGLTPESPTEVIVEHEDNFVGFAYVEALEILLLESLYTGIWSIPLSPQGTNAGIPERLLPNGEDMSLSDDGIFVYRALENRLETEPFRWIDRDGRATEAIPSGKRDPRWLALSPDDTQVTFTGPRASGQPYDIWVLDLVRGAETRITVEPGAGDMPAWRGNDTLVFTSRPLRGGAPSLLSQPASGAGSPEVIVEDGLFRNPAASADGRFVVFEALTADDAMLRPLPGGDRGAPENGSSARPGSGPDAAASSTPRGGDRSSPGRRGESTPPAPATQGGAPDPAAAETQGGARDPAARLAWNIYYVDENNGAATAYRTTDDNETRPAPSPDGTLLAYVSDASGSNEIWVDTFPQPTQPLRISVGGGGNVRWSGSGDELIYDDGDDTLWSVRVDTRADHGRSAYGDPQRLFAQGDAATRFASFASRSWDVGRDGDAILTIQRYAEGISDVNVIDNFPRWYRDSR